MTPEPSPPAQPAPAGRGAIEVTTDIERCVAVLRRGGLVGIPTETVYGLAGDAERPDAVARIFAAKGRPGDHPVIVHLAAEADLEGWIGPVSGPTRRAIDALAVSCWPGPLTMLVPRGRRVIDAVTGGRATVGLRIPAHPSALALLASFGGAVAAPSANRFGKVSPTTAAHVVADLGAWLDPGDDLVLDGGPCPVGVESTIVDLSVSPPQLLRAGAISSEQIERIIDVGVVAAAGPSRASGMLASHYAPECEVVLVDTVDAARAEARRRRAAGATVGVLDRTADLVVAARRLYADLRDADADGLDALVVVLPAPEGMGLALRDRLYKAAARR